MTTPRIPREPLAAWVTPPTIPADLRLPEWIERVRFLEWLAAALERYEEAIQWQTLSHEHLLQRNIAIGWLESALRDLERGKVVRLRNRPTSPMPGNSHAACWMQAYKAGLDWDALVSNDAPDPERAALLRRLIMAAIDSMRSERVKRGPAKRGHKGFKARDELLREIRDRLTECTRWDDKCARNVPITAAEALEVADGILVGCRVPSPVNPRARARAARRTSRKPGQSG